MFYNKVKKTWSNEKNEGERNDVQDEGNKKRKIEWNEKKNTERKNKINWMGRRINEINKRNMKKEGDLLGMSN